MDEYLQRIYKQNKEKLKENEKLKDAFFELRDVIHRLVKNCSDNVQIALYIDHFFDEPILINKGNMENRLIISFKSNGEMTKSWTKETWAKKMWDLIYGDLDSINKLWKLLTSTMIMIQDTITFLNKGAVAWNELKAILNK